MPGSEEAIPHTEDRAKISLLAGACTVSEAGVMPLVEEGRHQQMPQWAKGPAHVGMSHKRSRAYESVGGNHCFQRQARQEEGATHKSGVEGLAHRMEP